ncbi:hypothetical protein [Streptomyces griseoruber]|uniref:hypothetical protein n=1 Tax=Streptomyces griseoruber TaxID=1943 RepID=UPI000AEC6DF8|nr:hypothetical protein [Streptomyces griseoruber]
MELSVNGRGLTDNQVDAMQAGLSRMEEPDAAVIVTDDFVGTVRRLTSHESYSTDRGASIVAARTLSLDGGPVVVVNRPEVSNLPPKDVERLLAHEAGHIQLMERAEGVVGRRDLVGPDWEWWLLCLGGFALDELRIERRLAELGYLVSGAGTVDHLADSLYQLNAEVVTTLLDPASSDVEKLASAVMQSHDWFSKHLAYFAAFRSDRVGAGLAILPDQAKLEWDDYVGPTWGGRVALYQEAPTSAEPMRDSELNELLQETGRQEQALLSKIGFRYASDGNGFSFRRVVSDSVCHARLQRAAAVARLDESA